MKRTINMCLIFVLIICSLEGCVFSNQTYYPEEDLIVYSGIDGASFVYSNKVDVTVHADDGKHMALTLKCYESDDKWTGAGYEVFEDLKYKYFTWHDYYLHIQTVDDVFYSLDINGYKPGEFLDSKQKTPKYTLKKYTANEFETLHPDYKAYEWVEG